MWLDHLLSKEYVYSVSQNELGRLALNRGVYLLALPIPFDVNKRF